MDNRTMIISGLGALTVFLGAIVADTWNDTAKALADVAGHVAALDARVQGHSTRLVQLEQRQWEARP